jgi:hypothetical protein
VNQLYPDIGAQELSLLYVVLALGDILALMHEQVATHFFNERNLNRKFRKINGYARARPDYLGLSSIFSVFANTFTLGCFKLYSHRDL